MNTTKTRLTECLPPCLPPVEGHVLCPHHLREHYEARVFGRSDPERARAEMATWTPERRRQAMRDLIEGRPRDAAGWLL